MNPDNIASHEPKQSTDEDNESAIEGEMGTDSPEGRQK